ncbi:MAG TPA: DUF1361 domain-containing protein [Chloroflexota bacterium]|nr:DUF1361 domain-containing protein [Chloroflexota bacterium]HUM71226.1 DUF1361 domain-containing protein [Chloroflexota bacterium]
MVPNRQYVLLFLALLFASTVSVALLIIRSFYSGQLLFAFLVWNLILAWLPFLFATVVIMFHGKHYVTIFFAILWLLFFPNALYIVTDLLHLRPRVDVPLWYDMILLFSFALTGLCLGFASLSLLQSRVAAHWGHRVGWLFALAAMALAGLGVYIGRFLRWNSWDVFSSPTSLLLDLHLTLTTPLLLAKMAAVTLGLMAVFTFTYIIFTVLPHTQSAVHVYSGD